MSPCSIYRMPGGGHAFVRYSGPRKKTCRWCACVATQLCDYPVRDGKTCDAPMCTLHAKVVGPNRDYCPKHAEKCDHI